MCCSVGDGGAIDKGEQKIYLKSLEITESGGSLGTLAF